MFDVLRTRKGKLKDRIESELVKSNPDIDNILVYIDDYETSNLETIKKLKRAKKLELNKINGALKQTIFFHGPITKELISSASKRIYGSLLDSEKESVIKRIIKWIRK